MECFREVRKMLTSWILATLPRFFAFFVSQWILYSVITTPPVMYVLSCTDPSIPSKTELEKGLWQMWQIGAVAWLLYELHQYVSSPAFSIKFSASDRSEWHTRTSGAEISVCGAFETCPPSHFWPTGSQNWTKLGLGSVSLSRSSTLTPRCDCWA
jgi:hypothetical protein